MILIENEMVTYRDEDTGYIMADKVNLNTHTVISKAQQEAYKEKLEYQQRLERYKDRTDNPFTMISMEGARKVLTMDRLNTKELGYFLLLQSYTDYDNMLKMTPNARLPMTEKEFGEVLRIKNKKYYSKAIEKFIELGLLHSAKTTLFNKEYDAFYIDEKYCLRGTTKDNKVVKLFINSLQKLYSQNEIKPANIGFLYRILPYIHYESNHLVRKPYEMDYSKAEALSLRDIVEITGMDENNVKGHLRMKLSDVHVFGTFKAGKNSVYKVNPSLFYRGVAPELVKSDFKLTKQSRH